MGRTLMGGGYEKSRRESQLTEIPAPNLVIQDYIFARSYDTGVAACRRSLEDITKHFPSAKIVISTSEDNFKAAQAMQQENGWVFPITGKLTPYYENPLIEEIITNDFKLLGYSIPYTILTN